MGFKLAAALTPVAKTRRVLLIESDPFFQDTLRHCLAEAGYAVVATRDSGEAVKAVMVGDFSLLLYDPMAPGLECEAFFKRIRRLDPELCERLVFLIGDHMDADRIARIRKLDGFVLSQPVDSFDFIDAVFSAEVCGKLDGIFERASALPEPHSADDDSEPEGTGVAGAAATKSGPVLLIEPDPCFRETVRYYLSETGWVVEAFQDSRDALKRVLSGDFAFVLYDPAAPGSRAAMFYQGIKRIDPELCRRLVFLIGDRIDAAASAFIRKIDGFVLRKPFDAKILADKIDAAELRGTLEGTFESATGDPGLAQDCSSADEVMVAGKSHADASWFGQIPAEHSVPAQASRASEHESVRAADLPAAIRLSDVVPPIDVRVPRPVKFRAIALAGIAFLCSLLVVRWSQSRDAQGGVANAVAMRESLEAEWGTVSRELQSAIAARPRIESEIRRSERLAGDRALPRWSPALRSLAPLWDTEIEVLEVRARGSAEDLSACEVHILGVAGGAEPLQTAERYRQAVESGFKRSANGNFASVRMGEVSDTSVAGSDRGRVAFRMIATISPIKASAFLTEWGN